MKDTKRNLCDTCEFHFATCNNGIEGEDFEFGDGVGNDNVCECNNYKSKEVN